MFDSIFLGKLKKGIIFGVIFTLLYILFIKTLEYTIPFVIGFIIAMSTRSINKWIQKRFKISQGISSLIVTTLVFTMSIALLILVMYKITIEVALLLSNLPSLYTISFQLDKFLAWATDIIGQIDPGVVSRIYEQLESILANVLTIVGILANRMLARIIKLPGLLLITVISFMSAYFLSKDYGKFSDKFYSVFSDKGKGKMRTVVESGISMTIGYIKAYSIVMFITFMQIFIGFLFLKIDYALILSVLCAVLDLLPVVGVIMVFIPLVVYKFIIGETIAAVMLIILFFLVQIVRQTIEPKIVSQTLDLHPLLTLAAIFIGIKLSGVTGVIYFLSLVLGYKILLSIE